MPNILVRDFSNKQKDAVDAAADAARKSTSKFCRDAAVLAAGGKLEDGDGAAVPGKAGKKAASKKAAGTKKNRRQ